MTDATAPARTERPGRPRKTTARKAAEVLAVGVLSLVVAEGLYLVFGNLYLRHVLPAQLNAEPRRQTVTWTRAWTWLPGLAHATDFRLVRQHPGVQWEVRADTASSQIGLLGLLVRRFRMSGLDGAGTTFRLRFLPRPGDPLPHGSPHAPPIEGLAEPPVGPEVSATIPVPPPRRWRWNFTLERCSVEDLREIWIGPFRFTGHASASTTMTATPGQVVSIPRFGIEVADGQVSVGPDAFVTGLRGDLTASLDRFAMGEREAMDALTELSVHGTARGRVNDVQLPRTRFPNVPWLGFEGNTTGEGELDIQLEDGAFVDGTRLRLEADGFTVVFPDYVVEGRAVIDGEVEDEGRVVASFEQFTIRKDGAPSAHVRGAGFTAGLSTRDLTLRHPLETFEVELDLPRSEIVDFDAYDDSIPAPLRVDIDGGTGTIEGRLRITEKESGGNVKVTGQDLDLKYEGRRLRTAMELDGIIQSADMRAGTYDLSGTRLRLHDGAVIEGDGGVRHEGWWGDVELPVLRLARDQPVNTELEARAKFRDTKPFIAMVVADKPLLKIFNPAMQADEPVVTASLRAGPQLVDVESLTLDGKGLLVRACLELGEAQTDRRGVVYADSGMLSAGVKFAGDASGVRPLAGKDWFENNAPLCNDPTHDPPD